MLVALGVSGGIAAYKACEVVRGLDRAGAEVQVILTRNATQFITPLTLQTLSRRKVLLDPFDDWRDVDCPRFRGVPELQAALCAERAANPGTQD